MTDKNLIPAINVGGSFEALAPFNTVVDPNKFYTVESIRTISEMEGMKLNLYNLIFKPVGVVETDFETVLTRARDRGSVIITLIDNAGVPVYLPTTYLKSFPLTDGHIYERMCLVVDLGACPKSIGDEIAQAKQHIREYIANTIGVDKEVKLGTLPSRGYTSAQQHDSFEAARELVKSEITNDVAKVNSLEEQLIKRDAYIARLEAKLTELATPTP